MHAPILVASAALSAALFATALTPTVQPEPPPPTGITGVTGSSGVPNPKNADPVLNLRQDMRKLWTEHTVWTRGYIVSAIDDMPDQKPIVDRLMKNQEEIGTAMAAYYGKANGERLTGLLKEHIQIAADVVKAAKTKDASQFKAADERWKQNADDIADFLSSANPQWTRAMLTEMMMTHLSTTSAEVKARIAKDWDQDIKAYDTAYDHILKMSDALSDGIVRQFPDRFRTGPTPTAK